MNDEPPNNSPEQLEGGTYEVIRSRLLSQGTDLRKRLGLLNDERQSVFGAVESTLIATERVGTSHNCIPRDIVSIGGSILLFGYNVQMGLKSVTDVADVFSHYQYNSEDHTFTTPSENPLSDSRFVEDFAYLYKYYRETTFVKFMVIGPSLFMVFRVGKDVTDIKCFKWLLNEDGSPEYIGNRFDHEYVFPSQQDFEWKRAHRDMFREGMHPHVSIEDRLFVETVGGDLTIKVEDNTESGEGIYSETVTDQDQTLDDAEFFYAIVGSLILLKILPYQEKDFRYFIYNEKVKSVTRIDSIEHSCVLLPEDHGIIFSDGYHLQSGDTKRFESDLTNMLFERRIPSPNGEDYLYVFYNRISGSYILMSYNLIAQSVDNPISCHGYTLFPDGELVYFRNADEPKKHHALQIWRTAYMAGEFQTKENQDSYLYKIGNADIVKCMAECNEVLNLIHKEDTYADLYLDISRKSGDIIDSYFWTGEETVFDLKSALSGIKGASDSAISEFDKVSRVRKNTAEQTRAVCNRSKDISSKARNRRPDDIMGFVHSLSDLRTIRGEVISLKELRYADLPQIEEAEKEVIEASDSVSRNCVEFLLRDEALDPYRTSIAEQKSQINDVDKVTIANEIEERLNESGKELELLIEIVGNLRIDDATQTTKIIDDISTIYSTLNGIRAALKNKRNELSRTEGAAQFGAQMKLLGQSIVNFLDLCDSPEKCDDYLARVMVQLEELEGKFPDFEEYLEQIAEKRDEAYNAFESRKVQLLESRNKRSGALHQSAGRILTTVEHRIGTFEDIDEINGYLAGDLMAEKVRDIVEELLELGDTVKADDIRTRLKTIKEDSVRQLKDRKELYVDGKDIIQFGTRKFSVNLQELEISIVPHNDVPCYHLSGTDYFEEITDETVTLTGSSITEMSVSSENRSVYRAEYLAWKFRETTTSDTYASLSPEEKEDAIRQFMTPRYREGYTKGVHEKDALIISDAFYSIDAEIGLLRFPPTERALALFFWEIWSDEAKEDLSLKMQAIGKLASKMAFDHRDTEYIKTLHLKIGEVAAGLVDFSTADQALAAEYLFFERIGGEHPVISPEAAGLHQKFHHLLTTKRWEKSYQDSTDPLTDKPVPLFAVVKDWMRTVLAHENFEVATYGYLLEAAVHEATGAFELRAVRNVETKTPLEGLTGSHSNIEDGSMIFDYLDFTSRMRHFDQKVAPQYEAYQKAKVDLVEERRSTMRLDEFKPKVMSAFVRNRLLDRVYLPLIGDNLAKQMGSADDSNRTDRMGMLLLISPPGYGKTTLMEYVANRLGITFMKINGPALGHDVTSLDPADAPNASAREEILKLNLSLEMGDNVMIYLDDIQHTHPEFLQKFISLCDAQRKIEGVWNGQPRTYDLRGKKVCVVMAGNPYTESGGKFQIPDMLANRADTYNLGDIIGEHSADFEASYIENCLTSNPTLSRLASRSQSDVYAAMKIAETGSQDSVDFDGNYSVEEISEIVSVMKKLMRVRDTILRVNLEYIRSAAMEDTYRTEPPFRLQGSYRNMNRIAEKILPVMTDAEVEATIVDHYENESQTLTTGAESNLLKFRELEGTLSEEENERWTEIKRRFGRNLLMGGGGENDPVSRVVGSLAGFSEGLSQIQSAITDATEQNAKPASLADDTVERLEKIISNLRAVPVDVEIKVVPVQEGEPAKKSAHDLPVDIQPTVEQKSKKKSKK